MAQNLHLESFYFLTLPPNTGLICGRVTLVGQHWLCAHSHLVPVVSLPHKNNIPEDLMSSWGGLRKDKGAKLGDQVARKRGMNIGWPKAPESIDLTYLSFWHLLPPVAHFRKLESFFSFLLYPPTSVTFLFVNLLNFQSFHFPLFPMLISLSSLSHPKDFSSGWKKKPHLIF